MSKQPTSQLVPQGHRVDDIFTDVMVKEAFIAEGAFGQTFLAHYAGRPEQGSVCVKLVSKKPSPLNRSSREKLREMFEKEVSVLRDLNHPCICQFLDTYEDNSYFIFVFEFLSGGALFDRIMALEKYTEFVASSMALQMISAVNYLHSCNIAHLDIKPENFVLARNNDDESIKLIDFGLAVKLIEGKDDYLACGTSSYKAPEMYDVNAPRDPVILKKCDVYSLGIVFYVMLTGEYAEFDDHFNVLLSDVCISGLAKDLLQKMLSPHYIERISIDQCFEHPWVREAPDIPLASSVLSGLKRFQKSSKFQRAITKIMAGTLQNDDKRKIHESFDLLDINCDGKLDINEILKLLQLERKKLGLGSTSEDYKRAVEMFNAVDVNNDGVIDVQEFEHLNVLGGFLGSPGHPNQLDLATPRTLFDMLDIDHSGDIALNELRTFMKSYSDEDFFDIFREADVNGDGIIDVDEFVEALGKTMSLHRETSHKWSPNRFGA